MGTLLSDAELARLEAIYPELKGECVTCAGKGSYVWQGTEHECDCFEQRARLVRYLRAGIGLPYQRLTWGDFGIEVPREVMEWLDNAEGYINTGTGLMISGSNGTGKTMLAMLILKDLTNAGYDCYATTFTETVNALIAGWSDAEQSRHFTERFMRSRVLVLDDLGKEYRNSFRDRLNPVLFDNILRTRVQAGRPTILTTNMTPTEINSDYGISVLSLLTGSVTAIRLTGDDYRPRARTRNSIEVLAGERRPLT